ncbi:hypothetical protein GIB67_039626 [Kingdonia uniflora]|uniref:Cyclin N-terminal domain-containing protein n=1 Tax=Kingdonia uniflora TaxID=39325 RepID=A0A7J7MDB7_9MAGN|nr:hypothetical protein GIB67_039626 [Kingdonia uniflora]
MVFLLQIYRFASTHRGKAWIMQLLAVACLSLATKMEEIEVHLSVDLQVKECKFIFEAKAIQRMELLVLGTLKWRMRDVTPFTFMDYFFRKNNDDLPPPSSQISRLVELILRLTRGIEYLEFKPSEVAAAVSISIIRETNLDKYLLSNIYKEMGSFVSFSACLIWKETNRSAHFLAAQAPITGAVTLDNNSFPDAFISILSEDAQGKIYSRH